MAQKPQYRHCLCKNYCKYSQYHHHMEFLDKPLVHLGQYHHIPNELEFLDSYSWHNDVEQSLENQMNRLQYHSNNTQHPGSYCQCRGARNHSHDTPLRRQSHHQKVYSRYRGTSFCSHSVPTWGNWYQIKAADEIVNHINTSMHSFYSCQQLLFPNTLFTTIQSKHDTYFSKNL